MAEPAATHSGLHSDQGARRGEHPGRARNPVIKVADLAWLEFKRPDLAVAEAFAAAFGFTTALRTDTELHLRGSDADAPCVLIRKGDTARFTGLAFKAAEDGDLSRLANASGVRVDPLPESVGGVGVRMVDPSGFPVQVVAGTHQLPARPAQQPHAFNFGSNLIRANATQRVPRVPATVQRLGHVVLQSTHYRPALDWYLKTLGLIVSDFLFVPGQRDRGPAASFIRCDRGSTPTEHHTLALMLGPTNRYVHSAYQVCDLDALAAGGRRRLRMPHVGGQADLRQQAGTRHRGQAGVRPARSGDTGGGRRRRCVCNDRCALRIRTGRALRSAAAG